MFGVGRLHGVFGVGRLHGVFGSDNEITPLGSGLANDAKPFNLKVVAYDIWGAPGRAHGGRASHVGQESR